MPVAYTITTLPLPFREVKTWMLKLLRDWNETLLHSILHIPHREHAEPGVPLSVVLRSHPPVPAHHRRVNPAHHPHIAHEHAQSFQAQLERERRREPRILKGWQRRIGAAFDRHVAD